jgi:3-oxoadipate enol-lactonase
LRYDQRGAGLSEKTDVLTLDGVVDDLRALLDAVGFNEPVVIVGTALGSDFTIAFAAQHPQRVARLVATSPADGLSPDRRDGLLQRAAAVTQSGMRTFVDKSLLVSYPESLRENTERFERYRSRWVSNDPESFAALNKMLASMSMQGLFERVECEALIISGTRDGLRPPAAVEAIARQFRNATYKEIDAGHFLAVQNPELFVQEALPFMRGSA